MLSIAHIPFAHPLQPYFLLGWAMLTPAVPDKVQAEVPRATWWMAAVALLLHPLKCCTRRCVHVCSVGVYTSSLNVIMPLRQVQRLVLEEKIVGLGLSSFPVGVQSNLRQAVKKSLFPIQSNATFICRKFCYARDTESLSSAFITKP